jgi:hypothetical protein
MTTLTTNDDDDDAEIAELAPVIPDDDNGRGIASEPGFDCLNVASQ